MEDVKAYVTKNTADKIKIVVFGIAFVLIGVFAIITKRATLIGIVIVVLGLFAICGGVSASKTDEKALSVYKDEEDKLVSDFKLAKSYLDDDIRLGESYIFRKKNSKILRYEDIKEIEYEASLSTSSEITTTIYYLSVVLKDGKYEHLYPEKGDHEDVALEIIEIIKKHNPKLLVK